MINFNASNELGSTICPKCKGTGKIQQGILSGVSSTQCKSCGFTAIGRTTVERFQKNGNLCSDCSGDYSWI